MNISKIKQATNNLLCKVVNIPDETGGYIGFQLFKECRVYKGDTDEWLVEIDANDRALPLMFEFKDQYFTYQLWNALRLSSVNQLRMYEILKQYEWKGERIISVNELKKLLLVEDSEYTRFDNFKARVLDSCKSALKENTDICYEYELIKKGRGGKVTAIKFIISKNKDHVDPLTLDKFIDQNQVDEEETDESLLSSYDKRIRFLAEACDDEFSPSEITVLYNSMIEHLPYSVIHDDIQCYNYLKSRYDKLKMRSESTKVNKRFAYLNSLIGKQ